MSSSRLRHGWMRIPPIIRLAAFAVVLVLVADLCGVWLYRGDRHAVVDVMLALRKGLPEADATQVLQHYESHFFVKQPCGSGVQYWAHADFVHSWNLCVTFDADRRLEVARVWTEDGPYHPRGVPPDIK